MRVVVSSLPLTGLCALLCASASPAARPAHQAAAATWTLVQPSCKAPQTRVGMACYETGSFSDEWTVTASMAVWAPPDGGWKNTLRYTVPASIPAGASGKLLLGATALDNIGGGADTHVCATPTFPVKEGQDLCAEASARGKPASMTSNKTVDLLPISGAPGAKVVLTLNLEDGGSLYYTYEAKLPTCKKPAAVGSSAAGCRDEVVFAFQQGGLPRGSSYVDMTTNGIGSAATREPIEEGRANRLVSASGRVVRTVEYLTSSDPPVKKEAKLVFKIDNYSDSDYRPGPVRSLFALKLELVSSTDPTCAPGKAKVSLTLGDGRGKAPDVLKLNVPGCPGQSLTLTNASPKKPLVRVAISEK